MDSHAAVPQEIGAYSFAIGRISSRHAKAGAVIEDGENQGQGGLRSTDKSDKVTNCEGSPNMTNQFEARQVTVASDDRPTEAMETNDAG